MLLEMIRWPLASQMDDLWQKKEISVSHSRCSTSTLQRLLHSFSLVQFLARSHSIVCSHTGEKGLIPSPVCRLGSLAAVSWYIQMDRKYMSTLVDEGMFILLLFHPPKHANTVLISKWKNGNVFPFFLKKQLHNMFWEQHFSVLWGANVTQWRNGKTCSKPVIPLLFSIYLLSKECQVGDLVTWERGTVWPGAEGTAVFLLAQTLEHVNISRTFESLMATWMAGLLGCSGGKHCYCGCFFLFYTALVYSQILGSFFFFTFVKKYLYFLPLFDQH